MTRARTVADTSPIRLWPAGIPPWADRRVAAGRHLDRAYTMPAPESLAAWRRRADEVRRRVLLAAGLTPMPKPGPLRARVFDRTVGDGYSVEKVHFESWPGFLCTGNLYRPLKLDRPAPGVLCPHGHWANGRLHDDPVLGSVPGRSLTLARLGFVAFAYDMVGYNDSLQIPHRPDMLGEVEAMWGVSLMGLQLYNSLRAVDFLQSLRDVDPERIGCTGTSGGGTQTFLLMAVDPRIKAAAPTCMVSNHMQGGCSCENGPGLRLDTTSVEIAACMAPRPLLLISSTQDWTNHTPRHELKQIRKVYKLYDAADRVQGVHVDAPHNYNQASREAMYAWFARWLAGDAGAGRAIAEPPFEVGPTERLRVFANRRLPTGYLKRRKLVDALEQSAAEAIEAEKPKSRQSLRRLCDRYGPALTGAIAAAVPEPDDVCVCVSHGRLDIAGGTLARLWIGRRSAGDRVAASLLTPDGSPEDAPVTLVVHPKGKAALFKARSTAPGPLLAELLGRGQRVMAIDPYLVGEGAGLAELADRFHAMNHFHAYNRSTAAERVQDILTAVGALVGYYGADRIHLAARGAAAVWALLARSIWPRFARTAVDLSGVNLGADRWWLRHACVPLVRRAGDVRTALALGAPTPLRVWSAADFPTDWARACYRAAGAPDALQVSTREWRPNGVAGWIAKA